MKKISKYLIVLALVFGSLFMGEERKASAATFIWPADGQITQNFSAGSHYGIDIAKNGTVNITASAAGTVSSSYYSESYGNVVFIKHNIGGQTYETVYAHMRSLSPLKEGDSVTQGQFLGYMGNTGYSFGQHLHFELHKGLWNGSKSNAVNPLDYLGQTIGLPGGDPENNPSNGSYAYVKVDYVPGYGVNMYYADGSYAGKAPHGTVYNVYGEKDGRYSIGGGKWIPKESIIYKPFTAHTAYPEGWGVNVYDGPNGSYKGKLEYRYYDVKGYQDGFFQLDDNTWVPSRNVIITKPVF